MATYGYTPDLRRRERLGLAEAVLCESKSAAQIAAILADATTRDMALLLTRLDAGKLADLPAEQRDRLDYDPVSRTAILGSPPAPATAPRVAVITAGTSDVAVAREALRTLGFNGQAALEVHDVGVAGVHRLMEHVETLQRANVIVVVAGMEGALPSVVTGLAC